jgi:hypothetical protein
MDNHQHPSNGSHPIVSREAAGVAADGILPIIVPLQCNHLYHCTGLVHSDDHHASFHCDRHRRIYFPSTTNGVTSTSEQ